MKSGEQPYPLDTIDRNILRHLQKNARMSNAALANLVGLSPAPCLRRVRALELAGLIREYVTLLDSRAVRIGVTVWAIRLNLQVEDHTRGIIEREVKAWPEVLECYLMTGDADFLLRVAVPGCAGLRAVSSRASHAAAVHRQYSFKFCA